MQNCLFMQPVNYRYTGFSKICSGLNQSPEILSNQVAIGLEGKEIFYQVGPRLAENYIYFYREGIPIRVCTNIQSLIAWVLNNVQIFSENFLHRIYVHFNIVKNIYESYLYYESLPIEQIVFSKYCEFGRLAKLMNGNWEKEGF